MSGSSSSTVVDLLFAPERANAPLLSTTDGDLTVSEFEACTRGLAHVLMEAGFERGGRVAIHLTDYASFLASLFAIWRAGGVAVPLNARLPESCLQEILDKSKPSHIMLAPRTGAPGGGVPIEVDLSQALPAEGAAELPQTTGADELALILFTSGTTGLPKGVCQTLWSLGENARLTAEALRLTAQDRLFLNTPPFYTSAICHFLTLLTAGGSVVAEQGFHFGDSLLGRLEATRATAFGGAPAHLIRIVQPLREPRRVPGFRLFMSSGDHLPLSVLRMAQERLPDVEVFTVYGLTEVSGRLCVLPPEEVEAHPGSVGLPLGAMVVDVLDDAGAPVPNGESGQIVVRGPLLMQGYLDEPELTAASVTEAGFATGDWGHKDAGGYVYVEGRRDDIFKRGGEKVSTQEILRALLDLGTFQDAAVLALEDPLQGKVPVAFVVLKPETTFSHGGVRRSLRGCLAPASVPTRVVVLDEIPRTGSGKAIAAELREHFRDKA